MGITSTPMKLFLATVLSSLLFMSHAHASEPVKAGAYYFEGWTGQTDAMHLTARLKTEFADREPVWGWHTGTADIMRRQIDCAADAGLGFFAFDWYWPEADTKETPLNDGLEKYLLAPNKDRLEFCLLVANASPYRLLEKDWDPITARWIELFKDPGHLSVDGKPLLIIFSHRELRQSLGGSEAVARAIATLQRKAKDAGLPGVTIAACCAPGPENGWIDLKQLLDEGYTCFTGYNYHGYPMKGDDMKQSFTTLMSGHEDIWNRFATKRLAPYIPVVTTGWDRRPWQDANRPIPEAYYPDRSPEQLEAFVRRAVKWLDAHPDATPVERVLLLYAWNENGEGGYLTPTKSEGDIYLKAVSRGLGKLD